MQVAALVTCTRADGRSPYIAGYKRKELWPAGYHALSKIFLLPSLHSCNSWSGGKILFHSMKFYILKRTVMLARCCARFLKTPSPHIDLIQLGSSKTSCGSSGSMNICGCQFIYRVEIAVGQYSEISRLSLYCISLRTPYLILFPRTLIGKRMRTDDWNLGWEPGSSYYGGTSPPLW